MARLRALLQPPMIKKQSKKQNPANAVKGSKRSGYVITNLYKTLNKVLAGAANKLGQCPGAEGNRQVPLLLF